MSLQGINMKINGLDLNVLIEGGGEPVILLWKFEFPQVKIPVFGIWSTGDIALAEDQMIGSAAYVDAQWRYERLEGVSHWIPADVPDKLSDLLLGCYR